MIIHRPREIPPGILLLSVILIGLAIFFITGGPDEQEPFQASEGAARSAAGRQNEQAEVAVIDTAFGRALADGEGNALYVFGRDEPDESLCDRFCANTWPPLETTRDPLAGGSGVRRMLLGTTEGRNEATLVTYDERPLYYYVEDRAPGDIEGQGIIQFDGRWLLVAPNGEPIDPAA